MAVGSTSLPQLQDFCLGGIAQDLNGLLLVNNHLQSSMWLELHCLLSISDDAMSQISI